MDPAPGRQVSPARKTSAGAAARSKESRTRPVYCDTRYSPEAIDMLLPLRQRHFDRVVRAYSAELYRFAYWLCRDRFVAEELVQETCLRAWSAWESLRDRDTPKPWLMKILRNEHARRFERKQFDYAAEAPEDLEIAAEHSAIELFELEDTIAQLPLSLREPFLLQVLGGFACAEIAQILDTTEGAVMVRLTRARQALRALLEGPSSPAKQGAAS